MDSDSDPTLGVRIQILPLNPDPDLTLDPDPDLTLDPDPDPTHESRSESYLWILIRILILHLDLDPMGALHIFKTGLEPNLRCYNMPDPQPSLLTSLTFLFVGRYAF